MRKSIESSDKYAKPISCIDDHVTVVAVHCATNEKVVDF